MLITLTTDFGLQDPFVGIMKGVIVGINPGVGMVDLTHNVPAQDVMAGALVLRHSVKYFPRGTIHVAVVDPGVGSLRRPLLIECDGNFFLGPDNGLLSLAVDVKDTTHIVHLSNAAYHLQPTSATFHGRDIFAPVSAHLSLGIPLREFGETVDNFAKLTFPRAIRQGNAIIGEIIYIDKFGNLFTNIEEHDLTGLAGKRIEIFLGTMCIPGIAPNYATAKTGDLLAVINSWGVLEIAVNRSSAQKFSGARVGDALKVVVGK